MKFQAFIEFPSIELATNALEQTHGLLVQDKPLVVVRVILISSEAQFQLSLYFPYSTVLSQVHSTDTGSSLVHQRSDTDQDNNDLWALFASLLIIRIK